MSDRAPLYEGDGILRGSPTVEGVEREARRMRAMMIGRLIERMFDWLEARAYAYWRRQAEDYLAQATDLADLERRMRNIEARRGSIG